MRDKGESARVFMLWQQATVVSIALPFVTMESTRRLSKRNASKKGRNSYSRWTEFPLKRNVAQLKREFLFCASNIESIQTQFSYFFVNKYVYCLHNMPDKRRLVTSKVCFGSEKSGLLDHSYNKCALV